MIDMIALCAGRSHDSRIRNRTHMITADSTRENRRRGNDHHRAVIILKNRDDNRDQDGKGPPGGPGRKSNEDRNDKHRHRNEIDSSVIEVEIGGDKVTDAELIAHALQCPGKCKDENGRDHHLGTIRKRIHEILETNDSARKI